MRKPSSRCCGTLTRIGPKPVAERARALRESIEALDPAEAGHAAAHRDPEAEAGRHLSGPALELILGGKAVEGGVQLEGRRRSPKRRRNSFGLASAG